MSEKICLIIPCFNEAKRLDFSHFSKYDKNYYFIFVNDGSKDNTLDLLKSNLKENMFLLDLKKNNGKAEAVRRGLLFARELNIFHEINWIGYWDADLSTPLYEVNNFIEYARAFNPNAEAIFGSRIVKLGSKIKRSYLRHLLGRLFTTITSLVLRLPSYDSQCGAKLFRKDLIDICFKEPFISEWIFDIEIILRIKEREIVEYPLKEWKDIPYSTLKIYKVVFKTIIDIMRLRLKYL